MSRLVIALGGNALGKDYISQQNLLSEALKQFIPLIKEGHQIVITHGNGPQAGMIDKAFDALQNDIPLDVCAAMSQGYIGYHIQKELVKLLKENNIDKQVVTVVTQIVVDRNDSSFNNPTKPIGSFYTEEEAIRLFKNQNIPYIEDAGRGYRRVVASPIPLDIIEFNSVKTLLDSNQIVITCGGGGIPVYADGSFTGIEAIIDKDLASAKLAIMLNADYLIILTAINQVEINYQQSNAKKLGVVKLEEIKQYLNDKQFASGSMKPKIEAAINFVEKTSNKTIITSLENIKNIFNGNNTTIIEK